MYAEPVVLIQLGPGDVLGSASVRGHVRRGAASAGVRLQDSRHHRSRCHKEAGAPLADLTHKIVHGLTVVTHARTLQARHLIMPEKHLRVTLDKCKVRRM